MKTFAFSTWLSCRVESPVQYYGVPFVSKITFMATLNTTSIFTKHRRYLLTVVSKITFMATLNTTSIFTKHPRCLRHHAIPHFLRPDGGIDVYHGKRRYL